MSDHDPVDAVILAFLDHLEDATPRPTLDHLTAVDQARAAELLDALLAARGIDPRASRPSVEVLLRDTPLAGLLPRSSADDSAASAEKSASAGLAEVELVLAGVDPRARVEVDESREVIIYSYLDLRARFVRVPAEAPTVTAEVRDLVAGIFERDPDTSRVGVVATRGDELMTQILSADDLGATITTPRGEPHRRWEPPLPLRLAARRMLEQGAPEWPAFDFGPARTEPLDLATVAADIARRVIERESGRSYRGDKKRAYQALVGQERVFADLVARVSAHGTTVDLALETARIWQEAA